MARLITTAALGTTRARFTMNHGNPLKIRVSVNLVALRGRFYGEAGAEALFGGNAPGHVRGVVGEADATVGAEKDDASVALEPVEEIVDGFAGGQLRVNSLGDAVAGPLTEDQFHYRLTPAGEGDGGGLIVRIAAAADERAVADAAGGLVEGASGGGGGGEVAVLVERHGTYGVVRFTPRTWTFPRGPGIGRLAGGRFGAFVVVGQRAAEGDVGKSGGEAGLGFPEPNALAVEDELPVVDKAHALAGGEGFRA